MTAPTLRARASALRSLGGFGTSVVVNGVISIAVVPIVIISAGAPLWAGIAIAQAIASFIGVAVTYGWAVTGPATVAGLAPSDRGVYFRNSVASRIWLALAGAPVLTLLVVLLAPGNLLADVLAAFALFLPALGASWFFVGERAPKRLLLFETLPRASGTALGATVLLIGDLPLAWFSGLQAVGAMVAVGLGWSSVLRRHPGRFRLRLRADLRRLTTQTDGVVTAVVAALYVNLPVVIAGAVLPTQAPVYAVADKLQKLALTAIGPVFQVTQGLVAGAAEHDRPERARSVAGAALALGLAVTVGFSLLGGFGVAVLSSGRMSPPLLLIVSLGVALGAVCVSAIIGLSCLTALGAVRQVAISTVVGALVGVPTIILAGFMFGIQGIAVSVALSELVVSGYQVLVLRARLGASRPRVGMSPLLGSASS